MLVNRIDREAPTLAAIGRRWATIGVLPDGRTTQQAGVVAVSSTQRVDALERTPPPRMDAWRNGYGQEQSVPLPVFFKPVAAFRAGAMLAERALTQLDLRWPAARPVAEPKSEARTEKTRAATTEDSEPDAPTQEAPASAAAPARAPTSEPLGLNYDAAL